MSTTKKLTCNASGYVNKVVATGGSPTNYYPGVSSVRYKRTIGGASESNEFISAVWFQTATGADLDALFLDTYFIISFTARVKMNSTIAPVGTAYTALLTSLTRNVSTNPSTVFNTVKAGAVVVTLDEEVAAETDIFFTVDSTANRQNIYLNGLGIIDTNDDATTEYIAYTYPTGGTDAPYIEYVYELKPTVSPTYPSAETVIVNDDITLTWDYTHLTEAQTHYDIDFSTNGIVWTNYADKVESATAECVVTAGTLSSRVYYWRVRVWCVSGTVPSDYSQTSFIAVINPETSEVDCDLMPKPTVAWTASEQQAFQIKFGDYDTGTIYSALGTYTIPQYFDDGTYGITVRTQNNLGIWSPWTTLEYFEIANASGDEITLTVEQSGNAINLIWETTGTYSKYYVYRDGIPIAEVDDTAYMDNFAYGTATYKIRGIMDDGYYTMSDETEQELILTADTVSEVDVIAWLPLAHSLGGPVSRSYSKSDEVSYLKFAGRSYPVSASSGFKNRRGSFTYAFKTRAEIETLVDLSGSTVIHKDTKGNRTIGVINDFSTIYTGRFYYSVSFNITQTDYNEAVEYD